MTDWRNLVFSPLDFKDPPQVDMDKFIEWHAEQKEYMLKYNQNKVNSTNIYANNIRHRYLCY